MALTSSQISSKLFKKFLGTGETIVSRQFFEEPKLGRDLVFSDQIWSQSNLIPTTAPSLAPGASAGVVQYLQLQTLNHVSGSLNLSYFNASLIDSIPFNYGDGTYNYQLFKNDGSTTIAFGEGDWIVDNTAGLLTFYGTLPSGVTELSPPKISFYKYIGSKGFDSGSGIGTIMGITAGNGLSGGGTYGFVTIDVSDTIAGDGLTFSSGVIDINVNPDSLEITGDVLRLKDLILGDKTFQDSLTVGGNLTINGTVSYIYTENVYISDNILTLNATWSSGTPFLDAGFEVLRGASQTAVLKWDESQYLWTLGLSGSTSAIITEAGAGLTKSGNTLLIDSSNLASSLVGNGLTSSAGVINVNVDNGISLVNDNIVLGGTISQDTTISGQSYDLFVTNFDYIQFTSSTFDLQTNGSLNIDSGIGQIQISSDNNIDLVSNSGDISFTSIYNLLITSTSSSITIGDGRGLVYSSDYSSTFVTHSLVTKKYVDSVISSINEDLITGVTAGDGLSGGGTFGFITIDVNTGLGLTISNDSISMIWGGTSTGLTFSNNYVSANVDGLTIYINDSGQLSSVSGASVPVYEKKISLSTSGDYQPTGFTLSYIPNDYSRIQVFINGQVQYVGDGASSSVDCYFWNGLTAKYLNNLNLGDELYWNGLVSGFDLTTSDVIYVVYEV